MPSTQPDKAQVVSVHMLCSHQAEKNGHLCHETSRNRTPKLQCNATPPRPDTKKIFLPPHSPKMKSWNPIFVESHGTLSNIEPFIVTGRWGWHSKKQSRDEVQWPTSNPMLDYDSWCRVLLVPGCISLSLSEACRTFLLSRTRSWKLDEIDQFLANIPRIKITPNHTKPTYRSIKAYFLNPGHQPLIGVSTIH